MLGLSELSVQGVVAVEATIENQCVAWILSNKVYFIYFCRVLSGAFDKVVKVWSQDGQVMHKFDGFRFVAFTRYSHQPSLWNHIVFQNDDDIIIVLYVNWPSIPQFQLEIEF